MLANESGYLDTLERIKHEIASSRQRAVLAANSQLVHMYWRIGAEINAHAEWGNKYLESLSHDIRLAYPGIKGFSIRNLRYMVKFAREFDEEFVQTVSAQLSWSHNVTLMDKADNGIRRSWYAKASIENGWSVAVLAHQIDTKLYERQALAGPVNNFGRTLPSPESELAQQALKDPYIFDFITARQDAVEHDIEEAMTRNITKLLLELGTGFAFVGRQYHLVVDGEDFYLDLLFYNLRLRSYFVIELKTGMFKPEFIGQLNFYLSTTDALLRAEGDSPSIGLLLCKSKNDTVAEYALRGIDKPMGVSAYRLSDVLPDEYATLLPSLEDIGNRV